MKKNGTGIDLFLFWLHLRRAGFPSQWSVPSPMEVRGPNLWTTREFPRWFFCEAFDTADNDSVNSSGNVMAYERSFPGSSDSKESACSAGDKSSIPGSGKIPWRRKWQPTPVSLPGKSHGRRSLAGHSAWSLKESDMTGRLHSLMKEQCVYG